jgi:hypothetical protein
MKIKIKGLLEAEGSQLAELIVILSISLAALTAITWIAVSVGSAWPLR